MSSSPFELFRRNTKTLMVFLTLLALFSFVILPSVAMYQQNSMGGGGMAAGRLATFKDGEYDATKTNYFTRNHYATVQFLRDLAELTMSRGGSPKVADFQYNTQQNAIQSLGINSRPGTRASVRTLMYAAEAKKKGLELDDTAIQNWLTLFTDGRLSDSEINAVLAQSTRNQMGQVQLYEQLRTQLLASVYQREVMGGLSAAGLPIVPPAQQWELFLRLNRQAVVDAYAINVADFVEQTNAKPSDAEIQAIYNKGKNAFPDDESAAPAFRRPFAANFEYLAGNLDDFINREIANLTAEQVNAEYQRRLEGGDFKLPDTPLETAPSETPETPAVTEETPAATEETPAANEEAPAETEAPATTEASATTEATPATTEATPAAVEEPAAVPAETPAAGDSGQTAPDRSVRLVAMQTEPVADDADAETAPTADAPTGPAAAEPAATTEAATTDAPAETPAVETPAGETPAADAPSPAVDSFENVRPQLERSMALQPALEKLGVAMNEVEKVMQTYFNERTIAGNDAAKQPKRPDLKALGEKLGMRYVETGLVDFFQARQDPIAQSFGTGRGGMQRGESFAQTSFQPTRAEFKPLQTVDDQAQISFVSWKTESRDEFIPTLKEIRDEVIATIRLAEARKLARAAADAKAKEFAATDKPIKELIGEDRANLYFQAVGPFSWMTSLGFGMQSFVSAVPELDRVGDDFMRQMFSSERNAWGVAPNMPESVFYVVRPVEFSPSTDELHQRFAQVGQRMQTTSLAVEEALKIRDAHYKMLDEQVNFEWNEDALKDEE